MSTPVTQGRRRIEPRYLAHSLGVTVAAMLICGLGGAFVGERVAAAIGELANHDELVLRIIGWCWGGLPWVVVPLAVALRQKLAHAVKVGLAYLLAIWCGSGALWIPSRSESFERRFGAAYPDAHPLGFGWAAGFLAIFATATIAVIVVLVMKRLAGGMPAVKAQWTFGKVMGVVWVLLTLAGLLTAVLAPLP